MKINSTVDSTEVEKFAKLSSEWWDLNGSLKTLHDINPPRIEFIKKYVNIADKEILDVGCGGGILCEGLAKFDGKITGLDVEPESVQTAKGHAALQNLPIEYVCSPIEHFEHSQFDVITCMEMLEHVQRPELILEHCTRLLKPQGYLFLSTINRTPQAYAGVILAAEYILKIIPRQTHEYSKFIKPSELNSILRKFNMNPLGMAGIHYNPFTRQAKLTSSVSMNYLLVCRKD